MRTDAKLTVGIGIRKATVLTVCFFICMLALSGCSGKEAMEIFAPKPFGFSNATWASSKSDIVHIMGRSPDKTEFRKDGLYELLYKYCSYDGYSGSISYLFDEETLLEANFETRYYSDEIYEHFNESFMKMYGKAVFDNGFGKVWYTDIGNVGIIRDEIFGDGRVIIRVHAKPENNKRDVGFRR